MTVAVSYREWNPTTPNTWVDWTEYLMSAPSMAKNLESENAGDAGLIGLDNLSLSFRMYEQNGTTLTPPGNAFLESGLDSKDRLMLRIKYYKDDTNNVQMFEGMADLKTLKYPYLKDDDGDFISLINVDVMDKFTAMAVLAPISFGREVSNAVNILNDGDSTPAEAVNTGTASGGKGSNRIVLSDSFDTTFVLKDNSLIIKDIDGEGNDGRFYIKKYIPEKIDEVTGDVISVKEVVLGTVLPVSFVDKAVWTYTWSRPSNEDDIYKPIITKVTNTSMTVAFYKSKWDSNGSTYEGRVPDLTQKKTITSNPIEVGDILAINNDLQFSYKDYYDDSSLYSDRHLFLVTKSAISGGDLVLDVSPSTSSVENTDWAWEDATIPVNYTYYGYDYRQNVTLDAWGTFRFAELLHFDKTYFGETFLNTTGTGDATTATSYDGLELLTTLIQSVWDDVTITTDDFSSYDIPLSYFNRLIDFYPLDEHPLEAVKIILSSMNAYMWFEQDGNLRIRKWTDFATRTISADLDNYDTLLISGNKNYFWDKLVDSVSVYVKSWLPEYDANDEWTGLYLDGGGYASKTSYAKDRNPLEKTLMVDNATLTSYGLSIDVLDNYWTNVTKLNKYANLKANEYLGFYGNRHYSYELAYGLDYDLLTLNIGDVVTFKSSRYFIAQISFDENYMNMLLVSVTSYTFDAHTVLYDNSDVGLLGGTKGGLSNNLAGQTYFAGSGSTTEDDGINDGVWAGEPITADYLLYNDRNLKNDGSTSTITNTATSGGNTTLTFDADHSFVVGQFVVIAESTYVVGGSYVVTEIPATNQILFAHTATGSGADTGTAVASSKLNTIQNIDILGEPQFYGLKILHDDYVQDSNWVDNSYMIEFAKINTDPSPTDYGYFRLFNVDTVTYPYGTYELNLKDPTTTYSDISMALNPLGGLDIYHGTGLGNLFFDKNAFSQQLVSVAETEKINQSLSTTSSSLTRSTNIDTTAVVQYVESTTFTTGSKEYLMYNSASTGSDLILGHRRGDGTTPTVLSDNDELGSLIFKGYNSGTATDNFASIRAYASALHSPDAIPTRLEFYTMPATGYTEQLQLVISSEGKLGFGVAHDEILSGRDLTYNEAFGQGSESFLAGWQSGNGWYLESEDLGGGAYNYHLQLDDLTVRGTMRIWELLVQQIRVTNGNLLVTAAAKTTSELLNGTVGEVHLVDYFEVEDVTEHGIAPFTAGDLIMCQVVNLSGVTWDVNDDVTNDTYLVKRLIFHVIAVEGLKVAVGLATSAPTNKADVAVGDGFVRFGNTTDSSRQGMIGLYSDDVNAPFIRITDNVSSWATWKDQEAPIVQIGKLDGIVDADFGGVITGYGGYFQDNMYVKGNIAVKSNVQLTMLTESIMIGNVDHDTPVADAIAITRFNDGAEDLTKSGIFGYGDGSALMFALRLDDSVTPHSISNWSFNSDKLWSTDTGTNATVRLEATDTLTGFGVYDEGSSLDLVKIGYFSTLTPTLSNTDYTASCLDGEGFNSATDLAYWTETDPLGRITWSSTYKNEGAGALRWTEDELNMSIDYNGHTGYLEQVLTNISNLTGRSVDISFKLMNVKGAVYQGDEVTKVTVTLFQYVGGAWKYAGTSGSVNNSEKLNWRDYNFSAQVDSSATSLKLRIFFNNYGAEGTTTDWADTYLDSLYIKYYPNIHTHISQDGFYVRNSPTNYLKFDGSLSIGTSDLKVNGLSVVRWWGDIDDVNYIEAEAGDMAFQRDGSDNQIKLYDGSSWYTLFISYGGNLTQGLGDLDDVDFTSVTGGDILTYNDVSGNWENGPLGSSISMGDISDVVITSASDYDLLVWDSTANGGLGAWVDSTTISALTFVQSTTHDLAISNADTSSSSKFQISTKSTLGGTDTLDSFASNHASSQYWTFETSATKYYFNNNIWVNSQIGIYSATDFDTDTYLARGTLALDETGGATSTIVQSATATTYTTSNDHLFVGGTVELASTVNLNMNANAIQWNDGTYIEYAVALDKALHISCDDVASDEEIYLEASEGIYANGSLISVDGHAHTVSDITDISTTYLAVTGGTLSGDLTLSGTSDITYSGTSSRYLLHLNSYGTGGLSGLYWDNSTWDYTFRWDNSDIITFSMSEGNITTLGNIIMSSDKEITLGLLSLTTNSTSNYAQLDVSGSNTILISQQDYTLIKVGEVSDVVLSVNQSVERLRTTTAGGTLTGTWNATTDLTVGGVSVVTSAHTHNFADLDDTIVTTVASGELLAWSGTDWINRTLSEAGISAVGHTHTESDITDLGSYSLTTHEHLTSYIYNDDAITTTRYLVFTSGATDGQKALLADTGITYVASTNVLAVGGNTVATQTWVTSQGYLTSSSISWYVLSDDVVAGSDEINNGSYLKFVGGNGIGTQPDDTATGTSVDPFEIQIILSLLASDWDAGSYNIKSETFESDVSTGTAPFTVASTTQVTNLNANLLDGNSASAFATSGHTHSGYASLSVAQDWTADQKHLDGYQVILGTGSDFRIYHEAANNSYMLHSNATGNLYIGTSVASSIFFRNNNADVWSINGGDLLPSATLTRDIGTSGTLVNEIFVGTVTATSITVGGTAVSVVGHTHAGYLTGNETITLSGDVSGSGTTSIVCTVANDSHSHSNYYESGDSPSFSGITLTGATAHLNFSYSTTKTTGNLIQWLDGGDEMRVWWDSSSNKLSFRNRSTDYVTIDYDNGNIWTTGVLDCDSFLIGTSGTMTAIVTTIENSDTKLATAGAIYDGLTNKYESGDSPSFSGITLTGATAHLNFSYSTTKTTGNLIQWLDGGDEMRVWWDSSSNKLSFRNRSTDYVTIDYDNGNIWTTGVLDCDSFLIGTSGTMTAIVTTIENSDTKLATAGAIYDGLTNKYESGDSPTFANITVTTRIDLGDSDPIRFGNSADATLTYFSTSNYLDLNLLACDFVITAGIGADILFEVDDTNGVVKLYEGAANLKLETTSTGIKVTGVVNATSGFQVNGTSGASGTITVPTTTSITVVNGIITGWS